MASKFQTPEVRKFPVIPKLKDDATAHLSPFKSKEEFQSSLGYPGELVDNWQEKAINKMVITQITGSPFRYFKYRLIKLFQHFY